MYKTKAKSKIKNKLWKILTKEMVHKRMVQKLLSVGVSVSLMLAMVPLGSQNFVAEAAVMSPPETLTPDSGTIHDTELDKWKETSAGSYESNNAGQNDTASTMKVPVQVTAAEGYAEVAFGWQVSSRAGLDYLTYTVTDGNSNVVATNSKSGEETAFVTTNIKLGPGAYTLTFTYQSNGASASGSRTDKGYVQNLKKITYSGVSEIPDTMFIAKDALLQLCNSTNGGSGLLASAIAAENKEININFGTRPYDVEYYHGPISAAGKRTVAGGQAMTWRVAGAEQEELQQSGQKITKDYLVLYSKEPMISANNLKYAANAGNPTTSGVDDSRFQTSWDDINVSDLTIDYGTYSDGTVPTKLNANHYGASNLRKQLQSLVGDYFKAGEQDILEDSTVTNTDTREDNKVDGKNVTYTIKDPLFAAAGQLNAYTVDVGVAGHSVVDKVYWVGNSWLRSPVPDVSGNALYAWAGKGVDHSYASLATPAGAAACRINLGNVLFAAAASGSSTAATFSNIDPNTPMTLRLDGSSQGIAEIGAVGDKISVKNANGWNVVVQGVTDSGQSWSYSAPVSSDDFTSFTAANVVSACGSTISGFSLDDFDNCKVWLEKSGENDGTLSYAISASTKLPTQDEETSDTETPETPNTPDTETPSTDENEHPDWGEKVEFAGKTMYVDAKGTTSAEITESGLIWLREESGGLATWYMLDNSSGEFAKGSRFWVRWLNNQDNPIEFLEHYKNLDQTIKDRVDSNKLWIFLVGVTDPNGNEYTNLSQTVPLYIQLGTDWDSDDVKAVFISARDDEDIDTSNINMAYPETDESGNNKKAEFAKLSLHHFSPYAIYDYLTDEKKAELNKVVENLSDEQKQQLEQQAESALEQIKTGDEVTYFTISGLGLIMTLALGLMIKSKLNKRKFE